MEILNTIPLETTLDERNPFDTKSSGDGTSNLKGAVIMNIAKVSIVTEKD